MRDPERPRNVALACCLAGPLLILAPFALPPEAAGDNLRGFLFAAGFMAFLFGGVAALVLHQRVKHKRRLDSGEGVFARWNIPAADWRAFLALDKERNERGDRLRNEYVPSVESQLAAAVAIVVGDEAIAIDDSLHPLPRRDPQVTRAEFDESRVRPSVIEFDLRYAGDGVSEAGAPGGRRETLLRIPVPAGEAATARAIVAHFLRTGPDKPDFFHGRGDGSDPEDLTKCWNCGFETHRLVASCERCGATMVSRRWARRYGTILVVIGLFLSAGMVILLQALLPNLLHPGVPVGGSTFTGSAGMANFVILLLGAVLVFGLTSLGYGVYQVVTGKRSRIVVRVMLAIVAGLYVVGWAIQYF
jgi:hypothetical protein